MEALDVFLTAVIAILATAFALVLLARLQDIRTMRRLHSELGAARARVEELEQQWQGAVRREPEPAGRFSRR